MKQAKEEILRISGGARPPRIIRSDYGTKPVPIRPGDVNAAKLPPRAETTAKAPKIAPPTAPLSGAIGGSLTGRLDFLKSQKVILQNQRDSKVPTYKDGMYMGEDPAVAADYDRRIYSLQGLIDQAEKALAKSKTRYSAPAFSASDGVRAYRPRAMRTNTPHLAPADRRSPGGAALENGSLAAPAISAAISAQPIADSLMTDEERLGILQRKLTQAQLQRAEHTPAHVLLTDEEKAVLAEDDRKIAEIQAEIAPLQLSTGKKKTAKQWGTVVGGIFEQGAGIVNRGVTQTADFLFGDFLQEIQTLLGVTMQDMGAEKAGDFLIGRDDPVTALNDRVTEITGREADFYAKNAAGNKAAEVLNKYGSMAMASVPSMVLAYLTGGAAQATTVGGLTSLAAAENSNGLTKIAVTLSNALMRVVKNINAQYAFIQSCGSAYLDALSDGASKEAAALYAGVIGACDGLIEVGGVDELLGGLQSLPRQLRDIVENGTAAQVLAYSRSLVSETGEDVVQNFMRDGMKLIYGVDVPLYSTEDPNALINPGELKETVKDAAIVSALMGGGQLALNRAAKSMRSHTSAADNRLAAASRKYVGGELTWAMQAAYKPGQNADKFAAAYYAAWTMGKTGASPGQMLASSAASYLSREQRLMAFESGKQARTAGEAPGRNVIHDSKAGLDITGKTQHESVENHGVDDIIGLAKASAKFVNNRELLYRNCEKIPPEPGFDDFVCHSDPDGFVIYGEISKNAWGEEIHSAGYEMSVAEYAEHIKASSDFHNRPIRLISCQSGAKADGAAKQLAAILGVPIMAPTEVVNVDHDGRIFLCDNEELAEIWFWSTPEEKVKFKDTGEWVIFTP